MIFHLKNDLIKISDQHMECDVFNPTKSSRHIKSFKFRSNLIKSLEEQKLKKWMVKQFSRTLGT